MFKFATSTILAATAAAANLNAVYEESASVEVIHVSEDFSTTVNVLPDAEIAIAMEQGTGKTQIFKNSNSLFPIGRDHTDWSWAFEHKEAEDDIIDATIDVNIAETGLAGAHVELEIVRSQIISAVEEFKR